MLVYGVGNIFNWFFVQLRPFLNSISLVDSDACGCSIFEGLLRDNQFSLLLSLREMTRTLTFCIYLISKEATTFKNL